MPRPDSTHRSQFSMPMSLFKALKAALIRRAAKAPRKAAPPAIRVSEWIQEQAREFIRKNP